MRDKSPDRGVCLIEDEGVRECGALGLRGAYGDTESSASKLCVSMKQRKEMSTQT